MKKFRNIAIIVFMLVALAFASTQGPLGGTGSGTGWTSPTNIAATDAVYATCVANSGVCAGGTLRSSTFGFTIPAGATINGITVAIVVHCSAISACDMTNTTGGTGICVTKVAGACTGSSKLDALGWGTTDGTATEGSGADLWGTTWTVAEVNATGFGAVVDPEVNVPFNRTMSVDSILITVTYTPAATGCQACFMPFFRSKAVPQTQTRMAGM